MLGWHWLREDRHTRFEPRQLVKPDSILTVESPLKMCYHGLHASKLAIDSLKYAPGPIVCRVKLFGEIIEDHDKVCATGRTCLWMANASEVLHEFACWCAERLLNAWNIKDPHCWMAIETKRRWLRGEAANEELDAVYGTVNAMAENVANSTTTYLACSISRAAANNFAWPAASRAAEILLNRHEKIARNDYLERELLKLEGYEDTMGVSPEALEG